MTLATFTSVGCGAKLAGNHERNSRDCWRSELKCWCEEPVTGPRGKWTFRNEILQQSWRECLHTAWILPVISFPSFQKQVHSLSLSALNKFTALCTPHTSLSLTSPSFEHFTPVSCVTCQVKFLNNKLYYRKLWNWVVRLMTLIIITKEKKKSNPTVSKNSLTTICILYMALWS